MHTEPARDRLDVLCVADMCVDLLLRGNVRPRFDQAEQLIDDYTVELGGSANIFTAQFAHLGGRAGVIGVVGKDPFGYLALRRLHEIGIDTSRVAIDPSHKTGLGVALTEPTDRAILTYLGTIDAVQPATLQGDWSQVTRHWHIASYFLLGKLRLYWPDWLCRLRDTGVTVSLDTNWDPHQQWDGVRELLKSVDVFLPNRAEVLAIAGERSLEACGASLSAEGPLVVIKCGSSGAVVFDHGHKVLDARVDGHVACDDVVDSVGAGDCFDAGFVRAWQEHRPLDQCLDLAMCCGVASTRAAGGIAAQYRVGEFA